MLWQGHSRVREHRAGSHDGDQERLPGGGDIYHELGRMKKSCPVVEGKTFLGRTNHMSRVIEEMAL